MKILIAGIVLLLLITSPVLSQESSSTLPEFDVITAENTEKLTEIARLGDGKIGQVVWSPNGRTLALSSSIGIWLYETSAAYKPDLNTLPRLIDSRGIIAFSPDSLLLASGQFNNVRLWDVFSGQQVADFPVEYSVSSLSFSPDGTILAISNSWADGCECTTDLWDISNLTIPLVKIASYRGVANWICQSVFNPDGHFLISLSCPGYAQVWDTQTGTRIAELPIGSNDRGANAIFTPDGNRLIVETSYSTADSGGYGTLSLWDFKNVINGGDLIPLWNDDRRRGVPHLALSANQTLMAAYSRRQQIQFIDLKTGQELTRIRSGNVGSMGFTANDQQFFAIDEAGRIWIWDVNQALSYGMDQQALPRVIAKNETEAQTIISDFRSTVPPDPRLLGLQGHQDEIKSVIFMPDDMHLMSASSSGSRDDSARLWNIASQEEAAIFEERGGIASLSPDGRTFASGQWNGTVQLWNVSTGEQAALLEDGDRDRPSVSAIHFSPSGALLAAAWTTFNPSAESETNWIRIWDVKTGSVLANLPGGNWGINALQFSPMGLTLASDGVSDLGTSVVKLWDTRTFQERSQFDTRDRILSLTYSPDGHSLACACAGYGIDLWGMSSLTPRLQLTFKSGNGDSAKILSFSPDGNLLVGISNYLPNIYFWEVENGKLLMSLAFSASSLAFSPNGEFLAIGGTDSTVRILGIAQ